MFHASRRADGVEAGRRLVEEDQLGIADQRHRDVGPPALPARQAADAGVALLPRPTRSIVSSTGRGGG